MPAPSHVAAPAAAVVVGLLTAGLTLTLSAAPAASSPDPLSDAISDAVSPTLPVDHSVVAPPRQVVGDARGLIQVSAVVQDTSGTASIETRRVRGTVAAREAVAHLQRDPATTSVAVADPVTTLAADPQAASQWALTRLRLPQAWQVSRGSGVIVAVVDTGADADHEDLAANLLPGRTVIGDTVTESAPDGEGHGTHVAGTIAAVTDNGVGVAGVAPSAQVLPIKALDDSGSGWTSDVAEGVIVAADAGAAVINLSLGGSTNNVVLAQAVAYAQGKGALVVAAAGNSRQSGNAVMYPAALPDVIAVAATDSSDTDASFSNTGAYVDLAAPGVAIRSTLPDDTYGTSSGTSMASPHAAGVAALLISRGLTGPQAAERLLATATDLGSPGWDPATGAGLVDPVAALGEPGAVTTAPSTSPSVTPSPSTSQVSSSPTDSPPSTPPTPPAPSSPPDSPPAPSASSTAPLPNSAAPLPSPTAAVPSPTAPAVGSGGGRSTTPNAAVGRVARPTLHRMARVAAGRATVGWRHPTADRFRVRWGRVRPDDGGIRWQRWQLTSRPTATRPAGSGRWAIAVVALHGGARSPITVGRFVVTSPQPGDRSRIRIAPTG